MTAIDTGLGYPTLDIMVDYDDVIIPWFETVDGHCVARWGASPNGPCQSWAMHEHYGRTREEWEDVVIHATSQGLYTSTEPFPYAVLAINLLRWYGHRIHIVTARGFMANGENIRRWTREHAAEFGIGHDTLTFAKDKVEAMEALDVVFDYAVDDGVHNFEHLRNAGVNVYLHNAPHNARYDVHSSRRVASLWEFANVVIAQSVPPANRRDQS